jgi:hypothetical protein
MEIIKKILVEIGRFLVIAAPVAGYILFWRWIESEYKK